MELFSGHRDRQADVETRCDQLGWFGSQVIGLFVAGLAYLSYGGWVDVKWAAMEDASRSTPAMISLLKMGSN